MTASRIADRLAIEGGSKHCTDPLPGWPVFDEEMIDAVTDVLRSGRVNYWTGEQGRKFEAEYAESLGMKHAIAVANGTVALELALYAIDLRPGDEVIVPSHTFVATASSVTMRGGIPIFADIDPETQNLTAGTIEPLINRNTRAIIAVHMAGRPCEMDQIMDLARRHDIKVIEDCAQAHGAKYKGVPVGKWGDISAYSFCQDKIITTGGEGGLVVTDDDFLHRVAWSFKDHGKNLQKIQHGQNNGLFRFLHDSLGTNWRMAEMQSVIGRIALERLPEWIETRRAHADRFRQRFAESNALRVAEVPEDTYHSYYKFYAHLDESQLQAGWSRDRVIQAIQAEGINCGSGSCAEIYLEEAFQTTLLAPEERLPNAKAFGDRSLMFQVHPTLTTADIDLVADAVLKVVDTACEREELNTTRRLAA
ncbi:DegT/DnrJ/EryC1/StrS family aminotransferase [Rubinisphaera margarita]|uniref:DegT/DnrJ/EryC1/StrS family aminotransferase n=1 Tax=Rubinisphaera margarita TaxID=2909586 RepID=UPI001EE983A3|nr:DegT/DnrJ/EryC1/StrS family aminotransferase [Rubinisphaera margarita]MCG6154990.1 DegT/DnrJ/EryC1/StrS family aminotransferase [Rubinisphaera margarita]